MHSRGSGVAWEWGCVVFFVSLLWFFVTVTVCGKEELTCLQICKVPRRQTADCATQKGLGPEGDSFLFCVFDLTEWLGVGLLFLGPFVRICLRGHQPLKFSEILHEVVTSDRLRG